MFEEYIDQRLTWRVPFKGDIQIYPENDERETISVTAANISTGGLQFYLPKGKKLRLSSDDIIIMKFSLQIGNELRCRGEICSFTNVTDDFGLPASCYSVRFIDLPLDIWNKLNEYCQSKIREEYIQANLTPSQLPKNDNFQSIRPTEKSVQSVRPVRPDVIIPTLGMHNATESMTRNEGLVRLNTPLSRLNARLNGENILNENKQSKNIESSGATVIYPDVNSTNNSDQNNSISPVNLPIDTISTETTFPNHDAEMPFIKEPNSFFNQTNSKTNNTLPIDTLNNNQPFNQSLNAPFIKEFVQNNPNSMMPAGEFFNREQPPATPSTLFGQNLNTPVIKEFTQNNQNPMMPPGELFNREQPPVAPSTLFGQNLNTPVIKEFTQSNQNPMMPPSELFNREQTPVAPSTLFGQNPNTPVIKEAEPPIEKNAPINLHTPLVKPNTFPEVVKPATTVSTAAPKNNSPSKSLSQESIDDLIKMMQAGSTTPSTNNVAETLPAVTIQEVEVPNNHPTEINFNHQTIPDIHQEEHLFPVPNQNNYIDYSETTNNFEPKTNLLPNLSDPSLQNTITSNELSSLYQNNDQRKAPFLKEDHLSEKIHELDAFKKSAALPPLDDSVMNLVMDEKNNEERLTPPTNGNFPWENSQIKPLTGGLESTNKHIFSTPPMEQATPVAPPTIEAPSKPELNATPELSKSGSSVSMNQQMIDKIIQTMRQNTKPSNTFPGGKNLNPATTTTTPPAPETIGFIQEHSKSGRITASLRTKSNKTISGEVDNLNFGGFMIRLNDSLPNNSQLTITISRDNINVSNLEGLCTSCDLVDPRKREYLAGICFGHLSKSQFELLRNLLSKN